MIYLIRAVSAQDDTKRVAADVDPYKDNRNLHGIKVGATIGRPLSVKQKGSLISREPLIIEVGYYFLLAR